MKMKTILLGSALSLAASAALAQDKVQVGVITTLSGPGGYLGADVRDGLQLAIDTTGAPVELVTTLHRHNWRRGVWYGGK